MFWRVNARLCKKRTSKVPASAIKSTPILSFSAALYVKAINEQHQYAPEIDSALLLPFSEITRVQQVVGSLLHYSKAIDNTLLPTLNTIDSKQSTATKQTEYQCHRVLD